MWKVIDSDLLQWCSATLHVEKQAESLLTRWHQDIPVVVGKVQDLETAPVLSTLHRKLDDHSQSSWQYLEDLYP